MYRWDLTSSLLHSATISIRLLDIKVWFVTFHSDQPVHTNYRALTYVHCTGGICQVFCFVLPQSCVLVMVVELITRRFHGFFSMHGRIQKNLTFLFSKSNGNWEPKQCYRLFWKKVFNYCWKMPFLFLNQSDNWPPSRNSDLDLFTIHFAEKTYLLHKYLGPARPCQCSQRELDNTLCLFVS